MHILILGGTAEARALAGLLRPHARDEDPAVAESAAANPSLPPLVMAELVSRGA